MGSSFSAHQSDSSDTDMGSSASRPSSLDSQNFGYPTEADVFVVRNFLLSLEILPLELIDVILDLAECWPRIYAESNETMRIEAEPANSNNASELCVLTPPIPLKQGVPIKIRYVKFTVKSHDQGWGDPANGAWTWFEASVIRFPDPNNPPGWLYEPSTWRATLANSEGAFKLSHVPTPGDEGCRRWHIQTNVCASNQKRLYQVVWTPDGGSCSVTGEQEREITDLTEQDLPRTDLFKGRMDASKEFIRLLQRGDRVALVGRALFPAWTNHVYNASVEIAYSVI